MAEELQSLLEKINEEGIKKAEEAKAKIIADARAEAERIIVAANAKAGEILKKAELESETIMTRGDAALRQSVRDIKISMQSEFQERIRTVVKDSIGESMSAELMGRLISEMVRNYMSKNPGSDLKLDLILPQGQIAEMEKLIKGGLIANLKNNPAISMAKNFASGMKISFKGSDVFVDFSDEALTDLICAYEGPRIAAAIKAEEKK